jgi:hypothetical protein
LAVGYLKVFTVSTLSADIGASALLAVSATVPAVAIISPTHPSAVPPITARVEAIACPRGRGIVAIASETRREFQPFAAFASGALIAAGAGRTIAFALGALPVDPIVVILAADIPTFTATALAILLLQVFVVSAFLAIGCGGTLSAVCVGVFVSALTLSAILTVLVIQAPTLVPIVECTMHQPSIVAVTTVLTPRVVIPASVVLRVVALILSEMLISIFTICFSSCGFSHEKLDSAADPRNRLHSISRRWHRRRFVGLWPRLQCLPFAFSIHHRWECAIPILNFLGR